MKKENGMSEDIEPNEGRELVHRVAKEWVREAELIPVRHLSLDVTEPIAGWELDLLERGVEIVDDDLGRPCVHRQVLGDLLREEREHLAKIAAEGAAVAVVPVPAGLPALEGGSAMASIMANDPGYQTVAEEFGRPKPNFLAEELEAGARQQLAERAAIKERKKTR
jgi:hypothetical protein